uniref:Protein FAR1-RELATED SEQUENCE n=1 Tax=Arundo donax TaxID=35708 RepID=A0A0A9E5R6_ARUDO
MLPGYPSPQNLLLTQPGFPSPAPQFIPHASTPDPCIFPQPTPDLADGSMGSTTPFGTEAVPGIRGSSCLALMASVAPSDDMNKSSAMAVGSGVTGQDPFGKKKSAHNQVGEMSDLGAAQMNNTIKDAIRHDAVVSQEIQAETCDLESVPGSDDEVSDCQLSEDESDCQDDQTPINADEEMFAGDHPTEDATLGRLSKWGNTSPFANNDKIIGAVEQAMRNSGSQEHMFLPVVGATFPSLNDAYQLYNLYSWEVGFSIRKGTNQNKANGNTSNGEKERNMQEFRCHKTNFSLCGFVDDTKRQIRLFNLLQILTLLQSEWYIFGLFIYV